MILQHCPKIYRNKPYGCGYGPIHPTKAFLDYWGKCPKCGQAFKPYRPSKAWPGGPTKMEPIGTVCAVRGPQGQAYCTSPVVEGPYCARHRYLNFE